MAKKTKNSETAALEGGVDNQKSDYKSDSNRQILVHAQYVKDLSFENPNSPSVLIDGTNQPDVEITVNVGAKLINENQYEVTLNIVAKATSEETALFLVDLTYAGIVTPENTDANEVNSLIMIEAPRLLFPFARAIISDATRDGGFLPLNIQPVDFVAVYQHNMAQQANTQPNDQL